MDELSSLPCNTETELLCYLYLQTLFLAVYITKYCTLVGAASVDWNSADDPTPTMSGLY